MRRFPMGLMAFIAAMALWGLASPAFADSDGAGRVICDENNPLCAEPMLTHGPSGYYIGHDEPSVLFYDTRKGAGNDVTYHIKLPTEPIQPTQDGANGATWDFEQRATYWFGMIMCDTQSAPEYQHSSCPADSDHNIHDSGDPASARYVGKQPGNAYMELQFYPPGWVAQFNGFGCPGLKWCVNLTIDSFNRDQNTGTDNNAACLGLVGREPVNWAYLTFNGHPHAPPDPISLVTNADTGNPNPATDLQMDPGDDLVLSMHDTVQGFQVVVHDRTTGQTGSMTASAANGFAQINYDPTSATCTETPYSFHPMFASSTKRTRSSWAAHTYNVAASDEIGHFEWCDVVNPDFTCASSSTDPGGVDGDEFPCFPASFSSLVQVSGCIDIAGDTPDFDGPSYLAQSWPGNGNDALTPTPFRFTSGTFNGQTNYRHVAFEADTARIEAADSGGACDTTTGNGCTVIPPAAQFYPQYTTGTLGRNCVWQQGGASFPGTTNTFGGSAAAEYGSLYGVPYPFAGNTSAVRYNDYHNDLGTNPCKF